VKRAGEWWIPDGDLHIEGYLAARGEYQKPHRSESLARCRSRRVALDVGAHIGLWSRELASNFRQVHAFEPVDAFRECFARNVTASNVVLHAFALGNHEGKVTLDVRSENSGMTCVSESGQFSATMKTLDGMEFDEVDYIKIDVEGFELFVLEGAHETLLRCRPVVTLEQKSHGARNPGVEQYSALKYLRSLGAVPLARVIDDWILGWPQAAEASC
jgi:FkbM family methyltransferase